MLHRRHPNNSPYAWIISGSKTFSTTLPSTMLTEYTFARYGIYATILSLRNPHVARYPGL